MDFQARRVVGILLMAVSVVFPIAALYTFVYEPLYGRAHPVMYTFPLRWLSMPLVIVGISLFLTGLLVGYYEDIF